jgi:hypothetical protein
VRWITKTRAIAVVALLLAAGALSSCVTSSKTFAGGAAGIAALSGRNPNGVYRTVLTPIRADVPPRVSAPADDPDRPTR